MSVSEAEQSRIDRDNKRFWNELCGSSLARSLGIVDDGPASLQRFDDWFMGYYPYLERHIPFEALAGRRVLEIGLGYGTVAQRLMQAAAAYHGLDIAAGPAQMAAHRARQLGVEAVIIQGSVLSCPFGDDTFDWVVTIGCLHHTGQLARGIGEVRRVLKPRGRAVMMVYNAASYRQWTAYFRGTLKQRLAPASRGGNGNLPVASTTAYDANAQGEAAPQTEFVTRRELEYICRQFAECYIVRENIGADGAFRWLPRRPACRLFGPLLGLDLYCHVRK